MNYILRDKSVITGKKNLEHLYTFKDFPVFMGCVDYTDEKKDLFIDMSFSICKDTGIIQLDKLLPLDILYQSQHVDGTGLTWRKYYRDFANYITKQNPKNILEIGGGKGDIAENITQMRSDVSWTIIEPNPLHEGNKKIKIIPSFFDEKFKTNEIYDTIVLSQVLEHIYNPQLFLKTIFDFLAIGGKLIFAYPNLEVWLKNKYTNAINFEHTLFLTDYFVDDLLLKQGFKLLDKSFYGDHSIFYTTVKTDKVKQVNLISKYKEYKKIFNDFIDYHELLIKDINSKIAGFKGEIYLFGAHIFAQYLLGFGLDKQRITGILDNSELKQHKRLYGTKFYVFPPEIIKAKKNIAVVLKAAMYQDEIKKQLYNINSNVTILE